MRHKITGWIAVTGLLLVIMSFVLRMLSIIDISVRSMFMIAGFTLMLLGTLWRVVLEMNEDKQGDNS